MNPKGSQFILELLVVGILQFSKDVDGQRPNKPIYEYDMNMFDAAELCRKIDVAQNKTLSSLTTFLHPTKCFFFRWIYCPNEVESETRPCGWWEQRPCDCDKLPHVGHNEQKGTNPEGVHPPPSRHFSSQGSHNDTHVILKPGMGVTNSTTKPHVTMGPMNATTLDSMDTTMAAMKPTPMTDVGAIGGVEGDTMPPTSEERRRQLSMRKHKNRRYG